MANCIQLLLMTLIIRILQAIRSVKTIFRGEISYYPSNVKSLQTQFTRVTQSKYALMFTNATSATEAALFALGVDKESTVGSTAYVIPSSYCAAFSLGAKIEFFDVDSRTLNLNEAQLENTPGIDVLIVTHFYGNPCDMPSIMKWATKNNVFVVEDCSHAHGASIEGRPVGSWADVGIFSLQGAKAVAAGEGGIAVTNDNKLISKMAAYGHQESYKTFSLPSSNHLPPFGYGRKMRAHPLGADLALVDLKYLPKKNRIYENMVQNIESLSSKSGSFSIPKVNMSAQRGGFCQGIPLIFDSTSRADSCVGAFKKNGINSFRRDYSDFIKYFSRDEEILSSLPNSVASFSRVVFVPFYQFNSPVRWWRFNRTLANLEPTSQAIAHDPR